MQIKAEIRVMTRELVDSLLAMNTKNRPIRKSVVDAYKRDVSTGKWYLTNQGIGVSSDFTLIDGQHRLTALAECGYPKVEMLIVWGLNPESQRCVDQGAKRSMRDVLQLIFNYTLSRMVPAVCNILLRFKDGALCKMSGGTTASEVLDMFEKNREYILPILAMEDSAKLPAPVVAAAVLAMRENPKDEERIIEFFRSVRSGENLNKTMPAYHLRNYLLSVHGVQGGGSPQVERFAKTRRALSAYLKGEPMGVLRV